MWGPGAQGGFQNALAMGLQLGQIARQGQERRDERSALGAFAADPSEANFANLAKVRPDIAIQQREAMAAQQRAAQEADLTQRAIGGDASALDQLANVNFDKWKGLDARQKAAAAEETKMVGQAALSLSQVPYAQRRDLILAYAQQMPQLANEINEIAFLPEAEQDNALRVAITEAGLVERFIQLEQPEQFNVGPGEGRYERDPNTGQIRTVIQPNYGGAAPFSPVPSAGVPTPAEIDAELRRRGVIR